MMVESRQLVTHSLTLDLTADVVHAGRAAHLQQGARSAYSGLAAGSKLAAPADRGGSPQSKTTPRSRTRPCGDASLARSAPDTRPCPLHPCRVGSWLQYTCRL